MKVMSEYFAGTAGNKVDVWTSNAFESDTLREVNRGKLEKGHEKINSVNVTRFNIAPLLLSNKWINKIVRKVIHHIPFWHTRCIGSCPFLPGMLIKAFTDKSLNYDIVHVTAAPYNILFYTGITVAKKTGAKLIVTPFLHISQNNDLIRKVYFRKESALFYEKADRIIIQTEAEKEVIINFCKKHDINIDTGKFIKLGMGIFPDQISKGNGERFRKKYNIKDPIVFCVGTKDPNKGIVNLVKTMKILWKKNTKATLVLAGSDTEEFRKFWATIDSKTRKRIVSIDRISEQDKWDLFSAGDVFSMVSQTDSFGIVYLEAWYYKKPVLGCNIPAISEVINDGKDGYLLPFDDVNGIADKIETLLNNPALRKELGESGNAKVLNNFTWDKKYSIIDSVYKQLYKLKQKNSE